MTIRRSILLVIFSLQGILITIAEDKTYQQAVSLYNDIGTVKGQVVVTNNPDLGRTPASGQYFLLQRADCRKCVVGVRADINGRYVMFLTPGKYYLIPIYDSQGTIDLIRKGQSREVNVRGGSKDTEFDIELEIPVHK